jgi:hypothetical protein
LRTKTFIIVTRFVMIIAFLLISSCTINPMKGYVGPDLSSDKTALIENGVYIDIEKYDGIKLGSYHDKVVVLPGNHTIEINLRDQMFGDFILYSRHAALVTFMAKAGHSYVVYGHMTGLYEWQARVMDKKSGDQIAHSETLPVIREWVHIMF